MSEIKTEQLETPAIPLFGYSLIREMLLPAILGKETPSILYWGGKELARKYPLQTIEEIYDFFLRAGWGNLTVKKERKNEIHFELNNIPRNDRLNNDDFQIEAGFLAETIGTIKKGKAETFVQTKKGGQMALFTIKWT